MLFDKCTNKLPDFTSGCGVEFFTHLQESFALGGADAYQQLAIFFVELHFRGFFGHGNTQESGGFKLKKDICIVYAFLASVKGCCAKSAGMSQKGMPNRHMGTTTLYERKTMTSRPLNHYRTVHDVITALQDVHKAIDTHGLDRKLPHLVQLRASQINGCAYCVKMHIKEARDDGETNERLDRLVVWRNLDDFTPREQAALAWTEALTRLERDVDYAPLRDALRAHFSDEEISALTATVAMINLWNRIQISTH